MNLKIRIATKRDIESIAKVARECFPLDYVSSNKKMKEDEIAKSWIEKHMLLDPFGLVTVAELENEIVGFVLYFMIGGLSGVVHIEQVAVSPSFQKKGIGTTMMSKSEDILRNLLSEKLDTNLKKLVLTTSSENPGSHKLYKNQGYKMVVNLGEMFFSGDEIMYEKDLR